MDKFLTKFNPSSPPIENVDVAERSDQSTSSYTTDSSEECNASVACSTTSKKKKYRQKYKKEWEKTRPWLKEIGQSGFCKLCQQILANDIYNINRHAKTKKHINTQKLFNDNSCRQVKVNECLQNISEERHKKIRDEIMLVVFCVQLSLPFTVMDYLPNLFNHFNASEKPIKCCSTKARGIVNTVVRPYIRNELSKELRFQNFSIIIDEGTDVSMTKTLTIIARYIPHGKSEVVDRFLGLIEPTDGTARAIFTSLINYMESLNIPLNNIIGLSTDNAAVMVGKKESVRQKLKEINNDLFFLGCTCHSLNLCSSIASKQLPPQLEKLVKNIYSFFSLSSKRQKEFKKFQEYFDISQHKILSLSGTRWLSLQAVVDRVIEQWVPLKHYFIIYSFEELKESIAGDILEDLSDTNRAYLLFLSYILEKINVWNKTYQSRGTLIHLLYRHMERFFIELLHNFIKREYISLTVKYEDTNLHLPISEMFFGLKCAEYFESTNIDQVRIKTHFVNYYLSLCNEVKKRFNFEDEKLQLLKYFDPRKMQSSQLPTIVPLIKAFPFHKTSTEILNNEWRSLMLYDKEKIENIFFDDYVKGWIKLGAEKNVLEENLFENLSKYMCSLATLPHSSAAAERSYSIVNDIKSAKRNGLKSSCISNLLLIKEYCNGRNLFLPPIELIKYYRNFKFLDGVFVNCT